MAGRAHGGDQSFAADANLERLFDREIVVQVFERAVLLPANDLTRTDAVIFH